MGIEKIGAFGFNEVFREREGERQSCVIIGRSL